MRQPYSGEYSPATRNGARSRWIAAITSFSAGRSVSVAAFATPAAAMSVALRSSRPLTTVRETLGTLAKVVMRSSAAPA